MKYITYILLLVFSWQIIAKGTVLISYQLNKSYIASNLCEQKAVQNNTCNGKCYLRKQLQKQENNTEKSPNLKDKYEVSVYIIQDLDNYTFAVNQPNMCNPVHISPIHVDASINDIYQPPWA